jgi:hypothetical protein
MRPDQPIPPFDPTPVTVTRPPRGRRGLWLGPLERWGSNLLGAVALPHLRAEMLTQRRNRLLQLLRLFEQLTCFGWREDEQYSSGFGSRALPGVGSAARSRS